MKTKSNFNFQTYSVATTTSCPWCRTSEMGRTGCTVSSERSILWLIEMVHKKNLTQMCCINNYLEAHIKMICIRFSNSEMLFHETQFQYTLWQRRIFKDFKKYSRAVPRLVATTGVIARWRRLVRELARCRMERRPGVTPRQDPTPTMHPDCHRLSSACR